MVNSLVWVENVGGSKFPAKESDAASDIEGKSLKKKKKVKQPHRVQGYKYFKNLSVINS